MRSRAKRMDRIECGPNREKQKAQDPCSRYCKRGLTPDFLSDGRTMHRSCLRMLLTRPHYWALVLVLIKTCPPPSAPPSIRTHWSVKIPLRISSTAGKQLNFDELVTG